MFRPRQQVRRNDRATTDMANIPQKSKDATEEALSAIQEALNVSGPATEPGTAENTPPSAPAPAATELFTPETAPAGWPVGEASPRRAANDDRAGIGQIL